MQTRRQFAATIGAGLIAGPLLAAEAKPDEKRKRLAVVTTLWTYRTHAWHMAERFLVGYPAHGKWHTPPIEVVSAYVDQRPKDDLSAGRAAEFGFQIFPTVAETLCVGGDKLDVDAVLLIGEHGDYPVNEFGQKQYPRYELFKQIVEVFRRVGRIAPVFNDKHLSWNFAYAKEMVETSRSLGFPLLAGSSLPVTWRMPAIDLPYDAAIDEALCVAYGQTDVYDFHALEALQCFVERRRGGETGVRSIHALRGDAVWELLGINAWRNGGLDPQLFDACLARSHTLNQPESFSHRRPTLDQIRAWVKHPIAYRIEYTDGLRATLLLLNGLVQDFTVAVRFKNRADVLSTMFHLPPNPNVAYSAALMSKAEQMFVTGKAPYPVERTLLTSGLVQAALQSLAKNERQPTPHLDITYQSPRESTFWNS